MIFKKCVRMKDLTDVRRVKKTTFEGLHIIKINIFREFAPCKMQPV